MIRFISLCFHITLQNCVNFLYLSTFFVYSFASCIERAQVSVLWVSTTICSWFMNLIYMELTHMYLSQAGTEAKKILFHIYDSVTWILRSCDNEPVIYKISFKSISNDMRIKKKYLYGHFFSSRNILLISSQLSS